MKPETILKTLLIAVPVLLIALGANSIYQKNQRKIEAKAELRNRKLADVPEQPWASMLPANQAEIDARRKALLQLIWGQPELPTGSPDVEETPGGFTVHQPLGINSVVEYYKKSTDCLAIYHVGHANLGDRALPPDMFGNCSLLVFDMPLLGRNPQPWVNNRHGRYRLTSHNMLDTVESPVHPLYYFVNPLNQVLNRVLAETAFKKVVMVGHSGGGWTTTLYAALDTRIKLSVPIAGSLPVFLFAVPPRAEPGDFEQHHPDLLRTVSYLDLYVMATDGNRQQWQMLSRLDDQAFAGDASRVYSYITTVAAARVGGTWRQFIDNASHHHEISPPMIEIIQRLLGV